MTETQRRQRHIALTRSGGVCYVCGQTLGIAGQFAHRIADTISNRKMYGAAVIDHPLNGEYVCCLRCNDAMNIGFKPEEVKKLIDDIASYERRRGRPWPQPKTKKQ